jgi:hypothetical protein
MYLPVEVVGPDRLIDVGPVGLGPSKVFVENHSGLVVGRALAEAAGGGIIRPTLLNAPSADVLHTRAGQETSLAAEPAPTFSANATAYSST